MMEQVKKRLIDADALQRLLIPIAMGLEKEYGSLGGAVSGVMMHIDNAPTVDAVEVAHGRWERMDTRYVQQFKCSVCRSECYVPTCMGEPMYDYCPNCGAKMDGDGNA